MANRVAYANRMDQLIQSLQGREKLLLHACCGPCSSGVLWQLTDFFDVTVFYYNPNIWPPAEYERRGEELARFLALAKPRGVSLVQAEYNPEQFYGAVAGLEAEPERGSRCTVCYALRMEQAARYAAEHDFGWFTSTLSVSPLKDPVRINDIGDQLAAKYGIRHLTSEFRKRDGYKRSLDYSREYGLYRQAYCGCEFSARARGFDEESAAAAARPACPPSP